MMDRVEQLLRPVLRFLNWWAWPSRQAVQTDLEAIDLQAIQQDDQMLDHIHIYAGPDPLEQTLHAWARTAREGT